MNYLCINCKTKYFIAKSSPNEKNHSNYHPCIGCPGDSVHADAGGGLWLHGFPADDRSPDIPLYHPESQDDTSNYQ